MSIHLIIDGYNLIRQSNRLSLLDLQELQLGREALIDALVKYKKIKRHKITVVFDGTDSSLVVPFRDNIKGIRVKFSHQGESADTVIKKMIKREREKAMIVSSDRDIINHAVSYGSATISSPAFEDKMMMAEYMDIKGLDKDELPIRTSSTKKKGPSKRLSKRDRRSEKKIRKL